jgi:PAS domain-containing protein
VTTVHSDARTDIDAAVHDTLIGGALASGGHAVFLVEEAGRIVAVNDAACRLLGYVRHELIGINAIGVAPGLSDDLQSLRQRHVFRRVITWAHSEGSGASVGCWLSEVTVAGLPFVLIVTDPGPRSACC